MKILLVILVCTLYAVFNVSGAAIIKRELAAFKLEGKDLAGPMDFVTFLFRIKVIIGFGVVLVSALMMFKALSMENFSIVAPLSTGINFMLTVLVGVLFFGDKITFGQYIGLLLIIVGILTLSLTHKTA